jgi:hypothetical protein
LSTAWHAALFTRTKRLPELKKLLAKMDGKTVVEKPEPTPEAIAAARAEMNPKPGGWKKIGDRRALKRMKENG